MLEIEVEISPDMAGSLATRIMTRWPHLEVNHREGYLSFQMPLDAYLDMNLSVLEEILQGFEQVRNLDEPLIVRSRNLKGPDSGSDVVRAGRFVILQPGAKYSAQEEEIVIFVESGSTFGTGAHPSTFLALNALDEYFNPPPAPLRGINTGFWMWEPVAEF